LPKRVKAATCEKWETALLAHLKETEGNVAKLEQGFQTLDHKAKRKTCKTTVLLLKKSATSWPNSKGSRPSMRR
jgi:ferritin-like metal-binding protein YciE